ncbi:hypothetical protein MU582_16500 [Nocardioidaceae bacterium SCSIO 66511]|nr:hypothetical protein MU582_16500 [Nocardioidaceae bacterium SCSIO 66511]
MQPIRHRAQSSHGLSAGQLRNARWWHPVAGVAMRAEDAGLIPERCKAIQLALPDNAVFTHVTSAQLRGWWLPSGVKEWPIIACTDGGAPHHDRRGVYVRRCAIPAQHRRMLGDVRVASSEWTIVELAEDLELVDLVVAIDSALQLGDCTAESLARSVVAGRPGAKRLRCALDLADRRSESPWESILRLVHVLSGIVDVEPQAKICDQTGVIVARADLRLGRSRRICEYDGAVHRAGAQHRRDLRRDKVLLRLGYERFGYTASEIHRDAHRIVLDAEGALGLDHDPRRVQGWLAEYRKSSLTPRGSDRLARRMRRFVRSESPRSERH